MRTRTTSLIWVATAAATLLLFPASIGAQVRVPLGQVQATRISGNLIVKNSAQVTNPAAMNSPALAALQQQKQAADLESGQIMSAPGGAAPGARASVSGAGRPGLAVIRPATIPPPPPKPGLGVALPQSTICMAGITGIRTVNQKKTGVIFTPDPRYNLYTITGCGFGTSAGRIYLQGTGAFPAHNGKLTVTPVDPVRGWSDRAIIAKLDPNVTGELDQNNISLVVETSAGQRAQANGFSFYAVRGPAFQLKGIPKSATSANMSGTPGLTIDSFEGVFASPCYKLWADDVVTDCTAKVFRGPGTALTASISNKVPIVDTFAPKLKPGFVLSAAIVQLSTLKEAEGDVLNPYMVKFTGNQVSINEQPMRDSTGHNFSFYGVKLFVSGPAGISNPLAD
jgi:hypothetical protein